MNLQDQRLLSFTKKGSTWPYKRLKIWKDFVKQISSSGFYHVPNKLVKDQCQCIYCSVLVSNWQVDIDPMTKHLENCPWKECRNLELNHEQLVAFRVLTFGDWWPVKYENCTVQKLAESGFVYQGESETPDACCCVSCGIELDGWAKTDVPWDEHFSRNPDCPMLLKVPDNTPKEELKKKRKPKEETDITLKRSKRNDGNETMVKRSKRTNKKAAEATMSEIATAETTMVKKTKRTNKTTAKKETTKKKNEKSIDKPDESKIIEPLDLSTMNDTMVETRRMRAKRLANQTVIESKPKVAKTKKPVKKQDPNVTSIRDDTKQDPDVTTIRDATMIQVSKASISDSQCSDVESVESEQLSIENILDAPELKLGDFEPIAMTSVRDSVLSGPMEAVPIESSDDQVVENKSDDIVPIDEPEIQPIMDTTMVLVSADESKPESKPVLQESQQLNHVKNKQIKEILSTHLPPPSLILKTMDPTLTVKEALLKLIENGKHELQEQGKKLERLLLGST